MDDPITKAEPALPHGLDRQLQTAAVCSFGTASIDITEETFKKLFNRRAAFVLVLHDNATEVLGVYSNVHDDDAASLMEEAVKKVLDTILKNRPKGKKGN